MSHEDIKKVKGLFGWQPGDEPAEVTIRRLRDGDFMPQTPLMLSLPPVVRFAYKGALYFLESGDYLFQELGESGRQAKFVRAQDVKAAFNQTEQDSGWMPAGVVRCGHNEQGPWYVYSTPPRGKATIQVDDKQLTVPLPRLVMLGVGHSSYLWALKDEHFSRDAQALHAPFPNVDANGGICWGNAHHGEADPTDAKQMFDLFFETVFNADLVDKKSVRFPQDVRKQLWVLHEQKARRYPLEDLKPVKSTIGQLIEHRLKGW